MIKEFVCRRCGETFKLKAAWAWYCPSCRKKRDVEINMAVKKRKIPTTEIGVGSGNSSKNKGHYTHGSFKTGIQAYRNIYRDAHKDIKCELCGSTRYLCIHHKDENRYNNKLDNLQCLCKSCHQKHHLKRDEKGKFTAK